MIDLSDFYKEVENKKIFIQRNFVRVLRLVNRCIPCNIKKKNQSDYAYVTICRQSDFDMVKASLFTLYKNATVVPNKVIIVSDGTWNVEDGIKCFSKLKVNVECIMWTICADFYKQTCPSLSVWASKHIWGKKMAAILYLSEKQAILFSDPDILWYGDPISSQEVNTLKFKVSVDNCHSYDQDCIKTLDLGELNEREPINCGAVYMHGGLPLLDRKCIECIDYEAEHCGNFAEQTVFGVMDLVYNSRWKMEQISSRVDDVIAPFLSKNDRGTIARHYLWRLKWIYWKEVFKMYFS